MIRPVLASALLAILPWIAPVQAADKQDPARIQEAVEAFVLQETAGVPGQVSLTMNPIDTRLKLAYCTQLQPFLPPGGKLWGHSSVGVRCTGPSPWMIRVQVTVRVVGDYLAAARPIAPGQALSLADIMTQQGDLTQLPPNLMTDPTQVLGKTTTQRLATGQPIRHDALRAAILVQPNQTIKLFVQGRGFKITSEGRALAAGSEGQIIPVRTASGQTISGTVRQDGSVEIASKHN